VVAYDPEGKVMFTREKKYAEGFSKPKIKKIKFQGKIFDIHGNIINPRFAV